MASDFGFESGEWTFIDREIQHPFEDISERDVERLREAYEEREWPYEVIQPDGTREEGGR